MEPLQRLALAATGSGVAIAAAAVLLVHRATAPHPLSVQQSVKSDGAEPAAHQAEAPRVSKIPLEGGDPARGVAAPAGFVVENLFALPPGEESLVCGAFDPEGRLLLGAQYAGIIRLDLSVQPARSMPLPMEEGTTRRLTGVHGLAFQGRDLWAVTSRMQDQPAALWKLRDSDADGAFDEPDLWCEFTGEMGEHGPHQVVIGPDGWVWVTAGNHTEVPTHDASRVPEVWGEDRVGKRLWDANGHAVGLAAPGGWIMRFSPTTDRRELIAVGFRNAVDIAFGPHGELFTFDADMEWDFGLPWYRPTRVCHVASGVDFGWRSGSWKWSAWYPDSLPGILDIGPGSPCGVLWCGDRRVGEGGLAFPEPWRSSLFILDWTFGTVYACALESAGGSWKASAVQFLTGSPLPLVDAIVGADGAVYLITGGRRVASAVERVRYVGSDAGSAHGSPAPLTAAQQARRAIEALHSPQANLDAALAVIGPALESADVATRSAARIALEHQPVEGWRDWALEPRRTRATIAALLALARCGEATDVIAARAALLQLRFHELSASDRNDALRGLAVTVARIAPTDSESASMRSILEGCYPTGDAAADGELVELLVAAQSRKVVTKALELVTTLQPDNSLSRVDDELVARNAGFGADVARTKRAMPPADAIRAIAAIRLNRVGWNAPLRDRYASWFAANAGAEGGRSYRGFVERIRQEAMAAIPMSEAERRQFDRLSAAQPAGAGGGTGAGTGSTQAAPPPNGPGRAWNVVDMVAAIREGTVDARDVARGRELFQSTLCASCHRAGELGGESGAGGPDLTTIAARFTDEDFARAVCEPASTVSDQYQFSEVNLTDGSTAVGRIVERTAGELVLIENLLDPMTRRVIPNATVTRVAPWTGSPMMPGLLNGCSPQEVRALAAFLGFGKIAQPAGATAP